MTDWRLVYGSQPDKPSELDTTSSSVVVYQRRNIERVTLTSEGTEYEVWQYEERVLSKEEYTTIRADLLEQELTATQLALVELYEALEG